jgi:hypothetical protein
MLDITFRKYDFRFTTKEGKQYIFDEIRKKNILLTPEEWVRQHLIHHLIYDLGYPKSMIAVEKEFKVNHLKKRFDVLIYTRDMQPFLLIECKSPKISLNDATISQIANYNSKFKAKFLLVSNGNQNFCFDISEQAPISLDKIPDFE